MTCLSMESWDGGLLEVRGEKIMWPWGHGWVQEGRRREAYLLRKAAVAATRKIPSMRQRGKRENSCLLYSHLCPPTSLIWKYKHALCNWAKVITSLSMQGFSDGHFHRDSPYWIQRVLLLICSARKYMNFSSIFHMNWTIVLQNYRLCFHYLL